MTTIVVNSIGMASDSGMTFNNAMSAVSHKKVHRIKGHLIGAAGSCASAAALIYDIRHAKEFPIQYLTTVSKSDYDCISLILQPDGAIWHFDGDGIPYQSNELFASIGTGSNFAIAAMMAGADLKEAMKIAIALDGLSGGRTRYLKL